MNESVERNKIEYIFRRSARSIPQVKASDQKSRTAVEDLSTRGIPMGQVARLAGIFVKVIYQYKNIIYQNQIMQTGDDG